MRGFRSGRVPWMTTMQRYSFLRMLALCRFRRTLLFDMFCYQQPEWLSATLQ